MGIFKKDKIKSFELLDIFTANGGNFIDTANVYARWLSHGLNCSEIIIGEWLKFRNKKNLVIATKGCHHDVATKKSRLNKTHS